MLDVDRHNLLGIVIPADPLDIHKPPQTPLNRMQHFLTDVHDTCYHTLGNAFPSLSRDLYRLPHLAESLIITVLSNLEVSMFYHEWSQFYHEWCVCMCARTRFKKYFPKNLCYLFL